MIEYSKPLRIPIDIITSKLGHDFIYKYQDRLDEIHISNLLFRGMSPVEIDKFADKIAEDIKRMIYED